MPRGRWRTRVFELAEARGWSQTELARRLGVDWSTLWRWQKGRYAPRMASQERAAQVFKRSRDYLFWWQDDPVEDEVPA